MDGKRSVGVPLCREMRPDRPFLLAPLLLVTATLGCGRIGYDSVGTSQDAVDAAALEPDAPTRDDVAGDSRILAPGRPDARAIPDAAAGDTAGDVGPDAPGAIDTAPANALDTAADSRAGDAQADATVDATTRSIFYIGPSGADTDPGTATQAWKTWSHALAQLRAGDTLVALDGDYGVSTGAGDLYIACGSTATACAGGACRQGSPAQPIRVVARNERRARVRWPLGGTRGSLTVADCRYWQIEGLHVEGADDAAGARDIVRIERGQDVLLRRLIVRRNNRYQNSPLINISYGSNVIVEESELFEGHRNAVTIWYSTNVTVRRTFIFSDDRPGGPSSDLPGGYPSGYECPRALDTGIDLWGSVGGVIENNVIEGACRAIAVVADSSEPGSPGSGDAARVLGNIGKDNSHDSFSVESHCGGQDPCTSDYRVATGTRFEHNLSTGSDVGFDSGGAVSLVVAHQTVLRPTIAGIRLRRLPSNAGLAPSAIVTDSLVRGSGANSGFSIRDHSTWRIDHSNAFMNDVNFDPLDSNVTASLQTNPVLGTCQVDIPAGSPMKGAGTGGSDIGATIRYRYNNGTLGTTPLWDPMTGRFPCGATVPGVNDETTFPGGSCAEVHTRLFVGPGCGRP